MNRKTGFSGRAVGFTLLLMVGVLAVMLGWFQSRYPLAPLGFVAVLGAAALAVAAGVNALLVFTLGFLAVSSSGLAFADESWVFFAKFFLLFTLTAASIVAMLRSNRTKHGGWSTFSLYCALLALWAVASTAFAPVPLLSMTEAFSFLLLLIFASNLHHYWTDEARVYRTLSLMYWVAVAVVSLGLLAPALGVEAWQNGRFRGLLGGPNSTGWLLASILPIGWLVLSVESRTSIRAISLFATGLAGTLLLLSGSRAGLLAGGSGLLVAMLAGRFRTWILRAVVLLVVVVGVGMSLVRQPLRQDLYTLGTGSGRLLAWGIGITLIEERPIIGWGFGMGNVVFPEALPERLPFRGQTVTNSYLNAAIEGGVLFAGALVLLLVWTAGRALRLSTSHGLRGVLAGVLLGCVVGGSIESMFEVGLTTVGGLLAVPLWTGLAAVHYLKSDSRGIGSPKLQTGRSEGAVAVNPLES
jgi:O-antigen ligase